MSPAARAARKREEAEQQCHDWRDERDRDDEPQPEPEEPEPVNTLH
jgi:hypothetical protein